MNVFRKVLLGFAIALTPLMVTAATPTYYGNVVGGTVFGTSGGFTGGFSSASFSTGPLSATSGAFGPIGASTGTFTGAVSAPSLSLTSSPLAIASGGTGSTTQNFVDLTTAQTVGGTKTFTGPLTSQSLALTSGAVYFDNAAFANVAGDYLQYPGNTGTSSVSLIGVNSSSVISGVAGSVFKVYNSNTGNELTLDGSGNFAVMGYMRSDGFNVPIDRNASSGFTHFERGIVSSSLISAGTYGAVISFSTAYTSASSYECTGSTENSAGGAVNTISKSNSGFTAAYQGGAAYTIEYICLGT